MGWFRKKYEQAKTEVKQEFKHRAKVRAVQKASYRQEQVKEAASFGRQKARYETQQRVKELKQPKAAYTFGGFAGPTTRKPTPSLGVAEYLSSGSPRASKGPSINDVLGSGGQKRKGKNVNKELRNIGL